MSVCESDSLDTFAASVGQSSSSFAGGTAVSSSIVSSSMGNSSVVTIAHSVQPNKLTRVIKKMNKEYLVRRYLARVTSKQSSRADATKPKEGSATHAEEKKSSNAPLEVPYPIRPDRSKAAVARLMREAFQNRTPECQLFLPSEGKFLVIEVDARTGHHHVKLLEGERRNKQRVCCSVVLAYVVPTCAPSLPVVRRPALALSRRRGVENFACGPELVRKAVLASKLLLQPNAWAQPAGPRHLRPQSSPRGA